uniref:DNA topoisomerase (ATP-hydrolyzing) n=1 Tax=viral metagenome TaxID=1070528 RepID=A0A6C0E678_9ZZZZ
MSSKKEVVSKKNETELYGDKVSEEYEMKDLHNHILTRPDSYIGSIHVTREYFYVPIDEEDGEQRMVYTALEYIQGLFKIVDEILVNARDQYVRLNTNIEPSDVKKKDIQVSNIWIKVDKVTGEISVKNDGNGVPIAKHTKEKIYIPEMVFGHLLTSSNYKEDVRRFTGGKNGYGAKCTNIYSTNFMIETVDHFQKKKYTQHFSNNMYKREEPEIISNFSGDPYTEIKFTPDYKKFGLDGMTDDFYALIKARAYDIAGCTDAKVKVHFNNCLIRVSDFKDYVEMHFPKENRNEIVYEKVNSNWEIAIAPNFSSELTGKQISFANGARTIKGGRHVQYIFNQVYRGVSDRLKKRKEEVKESILRYNMMIFVNCTIDSPNFDGQTKEELTTEIKKLYPTCTVSEKFMNQLMKTSIIENAIQFGKATQSLATPKNALTRKSILRDIPKLEDANDAGSKHWNECVLIITEGDSAKSMVMKALPNRDRYGVFPIRGKLLNVLEATDKQIKENNEINNILRILGITTKKYVKGTPLRYGKMMIMTDQDLDGAHIKGLILNFLKYLGLEQFDGFACSFITPIVKITKGSNHKAFYSSQEFDKWLAQNNGGKGWTTKYYKGLGTSTDKEAREYFEDIDKHLTSYEWDDKSSDAITLAFNGEKEHIRDRKTWLCAYDPNVAPDYSKKVNITDFFNKEYIHFSNYDNVRSIPNICDGFKPSQRKILYCAFEKRNLKNDVKVAQFGSAVAETTGYHHGEVSLFGAIVNMAQDYIGSNNINLFVPSGQFGSRYEAGKDSGAPRYIFTRLQPITSLIFRSEDKHLLKQLKDDDGNFIEPQWYLPIIPMCLVNGTEGIGTGYSTGLPPFNVTDIIANLRLLMKGQPTFEMIPWFRGFSRNVSTKKIANCSYVIKGKYSMDIENDTLHVTELPIGTSSASYKEFLSSLLGCAPVKTKKGSQNSSKTAGKFDHCVRDFKNNSGGNKVDFTIYFEKGGLEGHMINAVNKDKNGITVFEKQFKLATTLSFPGKMVLYDHNNTLKVYQSIDEILKDFFTVRLDYYKKRRLYLLDALQKESHFINIKAKFVKDVIEGRIIIFDSSKKKSNSKIQISADLEKADYPMMVDEQLKELKDMTDVDRLTGNYDYLLDMKLVALTQEKVDILLAKKKEVDDNYQSLKNKTEVDLWEHDLQEFEEQYKKDVKLYEKTLADEFKGNVQKSVDDKDKDKKKKTGKTVTKTIKKGAKSAKETEEDE